MHVLLVQDDLDTRDLLRHALKIEGHEVSQAFGTTDALRFSHTHPGIDVVVMDVSHSRGFPMMALVQELRRCLHNGYYILASGDWDTLEPSCQKDMTVLRKPYGKRDVLEAIRLCTDRLAHESILQHSA